MSSANPIIVAQAVTFTATVTPVDAPGTMAFIDENSVPIAGCEGADRRRPRR